MYFILNQISNKEIFVSNPYKIVNLYKTKEEILDYFKEKKFVQR